MCSAACYNTLGSGGEARRIKNMYIETSNDIWFEISTAVKDGNV